MVIRPSKNDVWFKVKQPRVGDVDYADRYFGVNGEFSERSDNAFKKHLQRYSELNDMPMYKRMNGKRVKNLILQERTWY
jgi:hypothetical protein